MTSEMSHTRLVRIGLPRSYRCSTKYCPRRSTISYRGSISLDEMSNEEDLASPWLTWGASILDNKWNGWPTIPGPASLILI